MVIDFQNIFFLISYKPVLKYINKTIFLQNILMSDCFEKNLRTSLILKRK